MFKKILIILCLSTIYIISNCMEERSYESESNYYIDAEKQQLIQLFNHDNQEDIVNFLKDDYKFASNHLFFILELAYKRDFQEVINYLKDEFILSDEDLKNAKKGDIKWIKEFTDFDAYLTKYEGLLRLDDFLNHLVDLGFAEELLVFADIFLADKVNYIDADRGQRLLQMFIRSNGNGDYTHIIVEFIQNAPEEELNADEYNGTTALYEAALAYQYHHKSEEKYWLGVIIEALIRHGARSDIKKKGRLMASDLKYFKDNHPRVIQLQREFANKRKTQIGRDNFSSHVTPKVPKKISSKKSNNFGVQKILTLAGVTLVGCAAFYLGYNYLNSKSIHATVKLK